MKATGVHRLFAFFFVFVLVSLACTGGQGTPSPVPPQPQPQQPQPQQPQPQQPQPQQPSPQPEPEQEPTPSPTEEQPTSGGWTSFTDENDFYTIQVPADWDYSHEIGNYYYIDQFKSPDEQALVENLVYDEGAAFTGNVNGKFALALLHTFYSNTGKEGDIRITDDNIQPDGSERLIWQSRGGGYSGISYFEVRNKTTFLMFTVEWINSAEDLYLDTLNAVIESYTSY
ncbi:MAG: hypothetical protein ACOY0R_03945 [Chloroflexota bacterium]